MSPHLRRTLVVVGHGMVAHRFVQAAIERGLTETHDVVVIGEEPRPAYDRVALTSFFEVGADALSLLPEGEYDDPRVRLLLGRQVVGFDPATQTVLVDDGQVLAYDELVLATGAAPFVPPVPGHELPGCFVYRTIEDLEAIREAAAQGARTGAVIGGGLLGLEAANALRGLGLDTHVVEMAPRLMAVQIDDAGGATLARHVEALGLTVHTGAMTERILGDSRVTGLALRDAEPLDLDLVVFSAGIRPRDALARTAGLALAERGGVLVDERCRTLGPERLGDRRVRGPGRPDVRPGRARLRDGRGGGRRDPRRPGHLRRRGHVDQAQAARRRRGVVRRRVRHHRGRARAGLRRRGDRHLQEAGRLRGRHPAARRACWSATRRRTACCGRWCPRRPTRASRSRPTPRS